MKSDKKFRHVLQPECKGCARFEILKSPCAREACIFRNKAYKPDWLTD